MPSKSSSAGKGKGKSKDDAQAGGAKLKAATSINVRHILVSAQRREHLTQPPSPDPFGQCEKHSKKEEALAKLRDGAKFDDVAREFSEDKARQGTAQRHLSSPIAL
jgi:peptidyl-prolyl cis-trans isomerase NIMA-interacting 4